MLGCTTVERHMLNKHNYSQRSTSTSRFVSAERQTSFYPHTCQFSQERILWMLPPKQVSKASPQGNHNSLNRTKYVSRDGTYCSPQATQVLQVCCPIFCFFLSPLSCISLSILQETRAAVPSCSPPVRGGNT